MWCCIYVDVGFGWCWICVGFGVILKVLFDVLWLKGFIVKLINGVWYVGIDWLYL